MHSSKFAPPLNILNSFLAAPNHPHPHQQRPLTSQELIIEQVVQLSRGHTSQLFNQADQNTHTDQPWSTQSLSYQPQLLV